MWLQTKATLQRVEELYYYQKMQKKSKKYVFGLKNYFFSKTKSRRAKQIPPSDRECKSSSRNN